MGYLASSSATDGNVSDGFRNASAAQYWNPNTGVQAHGDCQGTLAPLSSSSTPFGQGAGVKNPRGPITIRRLQRPPGDGNWSWTQPCTGPVPPGAESVHPYVMVFYNNHDTSYTSRDPYWLSVGWEVIDSEQTAEAGHNPSILWSQPEVALYDRADHTDRFEYSPMLVE